mmetsp:Transcript_63691/g.101352  ORF Transcript_63691/g.101352 Transcript_63691/m.101352 type:complete len:545 (-) Transcript_63691:76-1710(-)
MAAYYSFLVASLVASVSNAAGFDYPATMPPPITAQSFIFITGSPFILQHETPIAIRIIAAIDQVMWNCLAVYHEVALDASTKQAPLVRAPPSIIADHGTSETRVMCFYYGTAMIVDYLMPDALQSFQDLLSSYGLDSTLTSPDASVLACDVDDAQCLQDVADSNGYTPEIMASIVAYLLIDVLQDDGWNGDGYLGANGMSCTANCNRYSDYTGYQPKRNDPHRWQPLQEFNGKGFSYHYDHVVPQIGPNAKLMFSSREQINRRKASDPKYDYKTEARKVVERLANLAEDDRQKMLVEWFDNKLRIAGGILLALDAELGWTYEQRTLHMAGFGLTEYEAVVIAWNEKRRWDLVRPTTLIKKGVAGDSISTYGGPYQGLQTIRAQDFESYIRVMPHSEYPSASACICMAVTEFTETELRERYGRSSIAVDAPLPETPFVSGSSLTEPGTTPEQDLYVSFADLTEFRNACGESRLWGGMHFTQSIEGGYELCDGLGQMGYIYMDALERGDEATLKKLAKKGLKAMQRRQKKRSKKQSDSSSEQSSYR